MKQLVLSDGWQCKQHCTEAVTAEDFANADGWIPARVPGCVHLDLIAAGHIPDPFTGLNENEVQWVGESDWLYRCEFTLPPDFAQSRTIALCCDGLDTFATLWLNGVQILSSSNMFVPQRVEIGSLLRPGQNELQIVFESAFRHGKQLEAQMGQRALWNGDSSRLYVRKAQYQYGWDWGPTLLTAGPWRAIRLEAYSARIADLHCPLEVAENLQSARLPVLIELERGNAAQSVHLALSDPDGAIVAQSTLPVTGNDLHHTITLTAPLLWWPRGYGEQPLYRLTVTLLRGDEELDRRELKLGLRRLRLVQQPLLDQPGTSFFFEINNTPIFCGGVNWIPADSFTPRITPQRYRDWLTLAAEGNMQMVRIWGGGIYEEDIFYDLCDEMGLLVWQDFLFACGLYPAHAEFQASVRAEAEANLRRLRHHPTIVLWCGNNEDYALADKRYDPNFNGDFLATVFPARTLYERLLPAICEELDPTRPYWPGSPFGGEDSGADRTIGDVHVWSVWQRPIVPYQSYPQLAGRFVSEYGMEAFPDLSTIASFAPPEECYPQSRTLDHHNKALGGPHLLASYITNNIRLATGLEDYIYSSQFIQAEAIGVAVRGWRRRWQGPGREYTAGALVWQLNDCWPVISWAIVDYYLRPKPAYYVMKRELAPLAVGLARVSPQHVATWVVNGTTQALQAELEVRTWRTDGSCVAEERRIIALPPNRATEIGEFVSEQDDNCLVAARLLTNGEARARTTLWPEPFKYLTLPEPEIVVTRLNDEQVQVSVTRPAKGVWLTSTDGDKRVLWSDNMLDLLPSEPQIVNARGLGKAEVKVQWLR